MLRKTEEEFFVLEGFSGLKGLVHGFSTRSFGNMSFRWGGRSVEANRLKFAKAVNFDPRRVVTLGLSHGTRVAVAKKNNLVNLEDEQCSFRETDGLLTDEPGVFLLLLIGDCLPVLLFDPGKKVIGLVHAGVKGAVEGIVPVAIERMRKVFGCQVRDIILGIGPSAGPCCYDLSRSEMWKTSVRSEFFEKFGRNSPFLAGKKINLWKLVSHQAEQVGLQRKNIEVGGICTICHHREFFSHYAAKTSGGRAKEGRFAAIIGMKG